MVEVSFVENVVKVEDLLLELDTLWDCKQRKSPLIWVNGRTHTQFSQSTMVRSASASAWGAIAEAQKQKSAFLFLEASTLSSFKYLFEI